MLMHFSVLDRKSTRLLFRSLTSGEFLATMFPKEIQQGRIYLMTQDRIHFWSPLLYVDAFQRLRSEEHTSALPISNVWRVSCHDVPQGNSARTNILDDTGSDPFLVPSFVC